MMMHPLIPLFWMHDPVVITWYDQVFLTLEKRRIVHLLWYFDIVDFRKVDFGWEVENISLHTQVKGMLAKDQAPNSPNVKAHRLEEGSFPAVGNLNSQAPSTPKGFSPPKTLWSDVAFDTLRFMSYHLPFSKEFLADYQALHSKLTSIIVNMKDNLLLRALTLHDVEQEICNKAIKEL
ncbi:hypothetical protein RYX36_000375 [Vicia faba]